MFEDVTKLNVLTLVGLGVLTTVLPRLFPEMRPALKSAIQASMVLIDECSQEAEAELIEEVVTAAVEAIAAILAKPDISERQRSAAVHDTIGDFRRRAHRRARRWREHESDQRRFYQRHVSRLHTALGHRHQNASPAHRRLLDQATEALTKPYPVSST